ncbi:MAG: hypothetical protein QUS14_04415 [Pyrinomonadaceae bacterium]|nr:hypothetical protein [Pyrinomonadaceae bacterium]
MKKRIIWALAGLIWSAGHGFFTMFATGGGHGNFLWVTAFFSAYLLGILIPVTAFFVADARPFWARVGGWTLVVIMITLPLVTLLPLDPEMKRDVAKSWDRSPVFFVLLSVLHFVPIAFFITRLILLTSIKNKSGDNSLTVKFENVQ